MTDPGGAVMSLIITAVDMRKYDVILDPLTGMDFPVAEVEDDDGGNVRILDPDDIPQTFMPEQRVALLERPWPWGKTEADMLDNLQKVVGQAWGAVVVANGAPEAMREALRRHAVPLRGALNAYLMGLSETAVAASDPDAPAPLPQS